MLHPILGPIGGVLINLNWRVNIKLTTKLLIRDLNNKHIQKVVNLITLNSSLERGDKGKGEHKF